MANRWIYLFAVVVVCSVDLSHEEVRLVLESPPLLSYGQTRTEDNVMDSYDRPFEVKLDFNITYFGSSYNSLYISKDGLIGFVENVGYRQGVIWSMGIRNGDRPFLAPFYHQGHDPVNEGHESYQGKIFHRVIYAKKMESPEAQRSLHFSENKQLLEYFTQYVKEAVVNPPADFKTEMVAIVTWDDVTELANNNPDCDPHNQNNKCKSATFQAVIVADETNTFAIFNYLKVEIPIRESYQAGFNGGFERGWVDVIPCESDCSLQNKDGHLMNTSRLDDLPNLMGSDMKGRYILKIGGEEVIRGGCLPPQLSAGTLEVYPREVGMFGGEKLEVSGKCLKATSKIYCKFGSGTHTFESEGVMINDMRGYCPVPMMTIRGSVTLSWSSDKKDWSTKKDITVVVPWMLDDTDKLMTESDFLPWLKKDSSSITVKWDSSMLSSSTNVDAYVQVKLIGYRETASKVEFKELEILGDARNKDESFTIDTDSHACTRDCDDFHMGLLEVGLRTEYHGDASRRIAIRFVPTPIGWYVNKELTKSVGSDWSDKMCRKWAEGERKNTQWTNDLPECPCSLDQALADFGRWQAYPGCDLFTGSKCRYHIKLKHCVSLTHPTSNDAGNMCCYHHDGTLVNTQLTFQAGGAIKKHDLGVYPYNSPGKVPLMSHMHTDIIPYVHCCYWTDDDSNLCHRYTKLRPTSRCENYEVPGLAMVRGNAHISTFDGSTYNFGGTGDFTLFEDYKTDTGIQGRFEPRRGGWDLGSLRKTDKTSWKPTALTHVVIQGSGEPIAVHPAPSTATRKRGLDIMINSKWRAFFYTRATKWQEFGGTVIINNAISMADNDHNNFTIITNNVGINVVALNNLLHVTVVLPPSMKNKGPGVKGMGLLGMFDGIRGNDYITSSNTQLSNGVKPKTMFENFAMSWAVTGASSLFTLPMKASQYELAPQFYTFDAIPHTFPSSPSDSMLSSVCGKDMECKWDYRISGSEKVARATKEARELFAYSQGSAYKVENCGLPAIGDMAVLSSYNFSVGMEITVTGCSADFAFDGQKTFKCLQERVEDAEKEDRDDYGRKVEDNQIDYIIHWVPEPYTICKDGDSEAISTAMIAGIAVGAAVVIILIIVIVVVVLKKRKGGSKDMPRQTTKPADRVRRDQQFEDGTDEPMMSDSRRPVYKPSKDGQRSSSAV